MQTQHRLFFFCCLRSSHNYILPFRCSYTWSTGQVNNHTGSWIIPSISWNHILVFYFHISLFCQLNRIKCPNSGATIPRASTPHNGLDLEEWWGILLRWPEFDTQAGKNMYGSVAIYIWKNHNDFMKDSRVHW